MPKKESNYGVTHSLKLMWVLLASEKIEENITLGSTEVPMDRVWASVIMSLRATDDT